MSNQQPSSPNHPQADMVKLKNNMSAIGKKILVLSGKGGVGKSTVAANMAIELSKKGYKVGLLDVDLHGPSIPRMTGLSGQQTDFSQQDITPIQLSENLKVMSIAFLLQDNSKAVIWRGPMKYSIIQKLLADTVWGELDYLVIDSPPGTGDEPLSAAQLVGENAGAVIVTTPQKVAIEDVARCIAFCDEVKLPVWGLIENMVGLYCPHCDKSIDIFGKDGGKKLAKETNLDLLASIPIDPAVAFGADMGQSIAELKTSEKLQQEFNNAVENLLAKIKV